ncbi:MAG: aminotransferase class I/II-fold pyridoxal phosphate-dependent enzyme [Myxococcales bacterium]|nr:aminotransferase class I/II-fold pyridoxal phosphate-dependent enzyme [Myxococcales bacterium]
MDALRARATSTETRGGFAFLSETGCVERRLTFRDLDLRARAIAVRLREECRPGDRVLMLYPPGLEFVAAFYGCLYAGVIAVPAYPPRANTRSVGLLAGIVRNAAPAALITSTALHERVLQLTTSEQGIGALPVLDTELARDDDSHAWRAPDVADDDVAFLQYTSGSTGTPKGVRITHHNLSHNLDLIRRRFRLDDAADRQAVLWLPPYHDMGLIGGVLEPVLTDYHVSLFSPLSFAQKPVRWLQAITEHGAVCSGAPDFAYDLCSRKVRDEDLAALDLKTWTIAFSGAEPVRPATLEAFARRFEPAGFRRSAFLPCYGMAESTLLVSGEHTGRAPVVRSVSARELARGRFLPADPGEDTRDYASCGPPADDGDLRIVDPETGNALPTGAIGEVWVASPSVAAGYWEAAEASEAAFGATLAGTGEGPFLRTGDLGTLLEGELFLVGRAKDMLIVRGRNFYPEDLEAALDRRIPGLVPGGIVAVGIEVGDEECLAIVAEVDRHASSEPEDLVTQVRRMISREYELGVTTVALIRQGSLPRTSSGKRQRKACREALVGGDLKLVHAWSETRPGDAADGAPGRAPPSLAGASLADAARAWIVARVAAEAAVPADALDLTLPLDELGVDSLQAATLIGDLGEWAGCELALDTLERHPHIESLAHHAGALRSIHDGLRALGEGERAALLERLAERPGDAVEQDRGIPAEWYRVDRFPESRALRTRLALFDAPGLHNPYFTVHDGPSISRTHVAGGAMVNFSSNNYLDLATDPSVLGAVEDAVARYGTSASGSRLLSGEKPLHRELEQELAAWIGVDDCLTFVGGNTANVSTIGHLLGPGDLVAYDELAHDSVLRGVRLAGASSRPFRHNDPDALDALLTAHRRRHRRVLVFVEGLYSMDGDIPDLARLVEVKTRHRALLMVDECLSIGVLGATGRGIGELRGVRPEAVDVWMGGLSKALASCGGYIGGTRALVDYLRYTTPGFIYTTAMSPANAAAALEALRVLAREPQRVRRLHALADLFRAEAVRRGLDIGRSNGTPVIPVMIPDLQRCLRVHGRLFDRGINVQPIFHPAVPHDASRLRFFVTCSHTDEQIRETVGAVADEVGACGP